MSLQFLLFLFQFPVCRYNFTRKTKVQLVFHEINFRTLGKALGVEVVTKEKIYSVEGRPFLLSHSSCKAKADYANDCNNRKPRISISVIYADFSSHFSRGEGRFLSSFFLNFLPRHFSILLRIFG